MSRKRPPHRSKQRLQQTLAPETINLDDAHRSGLVISRFGANLDVEDETGCVYRCTSRRKHGAIVCGDRVVWTLAHDNHGVIIERQERSTFLARPDDVGREKAIAANIDQLIIVSTVKALNDEGYRFHHNLIDRYFVAAENLGITPVLIVNKIDLLNEEEQARLQRDTACYSDIGYQVLQTSTEQTHGLEALTEQLSRHTSIFVGESGVGKSSIIRHLLPETEIRIGEVSASSGKGKHTTTAAVLYHLKDGGDLIDSPGVREFGLSLVEKISLAHCFKEFRSYIGQCKFHNCTHQSEPKCAVKQAIAAKKISQRRYDNYIKIMASDEMKGTSI